MGHRKFTCFAAILFFASSLMAQKNIRTVKEKCGTVQRLELKFERDPSLKAKFEEQRQRFNRTLGQSKLQTSVNRMATTTTAIINIPVVFHIVMTNPNLVTDAQIQAQLDTLNKDFFGTNGDSLKIPAVFKSLFGKSEIQFCLAQRTPDDDVTTGIERITTDQSSFGIDDGVKHATTGGINIWDGDKYYNVWVCSMSSGLLGYAAFPDDGSPDEQGVVIDYRSLPGGAYAAFNGGKTLTHETGHYFNLYHIWGDDNGACTGTDYVGDTPNQADATSGCYSGIRTDNCTPGGDGIMYQNYMDYSDDDCLVMFTKEQVDRMESALSTYRSSLFSSNGCQAPVLKNYNAQLKSIDQPGQRLCANSFIPVVTIRNRGSQALTSLTITTRIDNGSAVVYNWTGSLATLAAVSVSLNQLTAAAGHHALTVYTSNPNGQADEDPSNDTLTTGFQYFDPVTTVSESFESLVFPPQGWDIVNPDQYITWERVTGIAKTGNASVTINNYDYQALGQKDDLRLPTISIGSVDSAFLSFQLAAASYTATTTAGNNWDTLEVLASTDCGRTYSSLYKKWGGSLVTRSIATTSKFIPVSTEWRKDSVNLAKYIGSNNLLIAFRNTTGFENNIYLDDINLRVVSVNPNLKSQGFLVTPNPTSGSIAVQFYPQPTQLKGIQVLNAIGQKIAEVIVNGQGGNYYRFDLSGYASGTYFIRAVFANRVVIKKITRL
jgi:hypothetical protein